MTRENSSKAFMYITCLLGILTNTQILTNLWFKSSIPPDKSK